MGARIWTLGILATALCLLSATTAHSDSLAIDFEDPPYTTGTIDLQDGWSSFGAAGSGCAVYDHEVVDNTAASYSYPSFEDQSLRMSNAVTSGCFGDQTFSKSLTDEAGETEAVNGGLSGGTRQRYFEAQWDFASTVPDAEQPGLSVVASPDRGDGARMSWVQMTDTPSGLEVNFFDFQTEVISGLCENGDFISTNLASGLDRGAVHTIRITMTLRDGPGNDIVRVFVDGELKHVGTSWEDFFRECQPPGSRTVDSILFRTGGGAAPDTSGMGFVIDNLTLSSGSDEDEDGVRDEEDNCKCVANTDQDDTDEDGAGNACDLLADVPVGQCVEGPNLLVPQADVICLPAIEQVCL